MKQPITVFRCGSLDRPSHRPQMESSFNFFDLLAPKERVTRGEAIFTSPERAALSPWIEMKERKKARANRFGSPDKLFDQDIVVRHLELNMDDSLFVYDADLFGQIHLEAFHSRFDSSLVEASPYWESGIPLSEWTLSKFAGTPAAESWEVLVAPHHIRSVRLEKFCPETPASV